LRGGFCFSAVILAAFLPSGGNALAAAAANVAPASAAPSAAAADQVAKPAIRKFDDWFYHCEHAPGAGAEKSAGRCEIFQRAQIKQNGKTVTVLSISVSLGAAGKSKGKAADFFLTGIAPLNIALPAGLRWSADGRDIAKASYSYCSQSGCWAQQAVSSAAIATLRQAREGVAHFRLPDGRDVHISFSLHGFSAALKELQNGGGGR